MQTDGRTDRAAVGRRLAVLAGPRCWLAACSFHMTTVPSVRSETDRARRTRPRSRTRVAACASSSWSSATPRPWSGGATREPGSGGGSERRRQALSIDES